MTIKQREIHGIETIFSGPEPTPILTVSTISATVREKAQHGRAEQHRVLLVVVPNRGTRTLRFGACVACILLKTAGRVN